MKLTPLSSNSESMSKSRKTGLKNSLKANKRKYPISPTIQTHRKENNSSPNSKKKRKPTILISKVSDKELKRLGVANDPNDEHGAFWHEYEIIDSNFEVTTVKGYTCKSYCEVVKYVNLIISRRAQSVNVLPVIKPVTESEKKRVKLRSNVHVPSFM